MKISNEFVLVAKDKHSCRSSDGCFRVTHALRGAKYNTILSCSTLFIDLHGDAIRDYIQAEKRREAKARKQAQQQVPPIQAQLVKAEVVDQPAIRRV